jgi:hypothetical protein
MRSIRMTVLSWLAVLLGFLVGLCALAAFGMTHVSFTDRSSGSCLGWSGIAGVGLFGLGFIAGSIVATRNRRSAGVIFLVFMPFAAFCLAYVDAGYLVWHADGSGWFEKPLPSTAIGLTALFFAPFLLLLLAIRHRKRALYLFLISACLAGIPLGMSHWSKALLPRLAGWSAPFALIGLFWLGTDKLGWPPLVLPRPRTLSRRVGAVALVCLTVLFLDVAATFALSALGSSLFSPACSGKRLFAHPVSPGHAVFTARVIFVGRSIAALSHLGGIDFSSHSTRARGRRVGDWAIGVVRERFWGLPSVGPRLVLLTNFIFWQDETYFIDGARAHGLLTRLLPIVEAGPCTRTRPEHDAIVDLRVLRRPPSARGTHLIGFVRQPEAFVGGLAPPTPPNPSVGAKIRVTGPTGTRIATTDQSGVYQLDDLPPGDYTLQLLVPDNQLVGFFEGQESPAKVHLNSQALVEQNFHVFWNGRIEGKVQDDSGKPAHVWVMLVDADKRQLPGYVRFILETNDDGSYQIKKIPLGRYIVMVNPDGPYTQWPYDIQYYPSALRAEDAQVLQVAEGQEIKGVNFTVRRLTERTVQVRVTWPNGSPVAGASLCVAYEHTQEYESLRGAPGYTKTDQNGVGIIHLYGNSRVRLFAEQFVYNAKKAWSEQDTYYSHPVESEIDKIPDKMDLVLTSLKP